MLGRYQIRRGASLASLPAAVRRGVRQDTRKHTRHCLRPETELVDALLAAPLDRRAAAWRTFAAGYRAELKRRFAADRAPFDAIAELARTRDVFLGCNCPTARQPEVAHCHTVLALQFMRAHYRDLDVAMP